MEARRSSILRRAGRVASGALLFATITASALALPAHVGAQTEAEEPQAETLGQAEDATGLDILPRPDALPLTELDASRLYFEETGHTVKGAILEHWLITVEAKLEQTGYPVTPAVDANGKTIQWFEYDRFQVEDVPYEQATSADVIRAPIGQLYADKVGYTRWLKAFNPIDSATATGLYVEETGHSINHAFLDLYQQPGNAERLGLPISEEFRLGGVTYQFFGYGALAWEPETGPRFVPLGRLDAALSGYGGVAEESAGDAVVWNSSSMILLSNYFPGERWIEIDLSDFTLSAYVGERKMLTSKVVIGPPQSPTPIGEHEIYIRHEIQDLSGIGWDGQPYSAPRTPWVMYFFEDFGIHGSTWRTTYGIADGQGCVQPPNDVAEVVWKWADYGTRVVVQE